jgi:transcriptional regulator GlxA family with amidase domain
MENPVPVSIFIDHGCWAGLALLVKEAFAVAGTLHTRSADLAASEQFRVRLVARTRAPVRSFTGPLLTPDDTLAQARRSRIVVVPPFFFHDDQRKPMPAPLKRWLVEAHASGAVLVCMASGVRLLAETGLLDGHEVTCNPADHRVFAQRYPRVRFAPETPLVIDGRIISAASINPCMDAISYLVGQFMGEAAARKFSRYTNSLVQPSYERMAMKTAPHKQHADQRIKQAQEFIERHFKDDISVEEAARRALMSVRNFSRRFQQAVGMAPHSYIARCRAEYAKDLLAQPGLSILQVAHQSGFRNEVTLRRAFSLLLGTTPTAYRNAMAVRRGGRDAV